jgi:hypothetical protein
MDPGFRSPLIDCFRRGEVTREVRQLAAQGVLAPRAHEQLALLVFLADDPDTEIASEANATIEALPSDALRAFLARADVPDEIRQFFRARGIEPAESAAAAADAPLLDVLGDTPDETAEKAADPKVLSGLPIMEKMKLAMKGTREQRAQLIRDSNRIVATAVLASPKLTDSEVESFTKMGNVSEDVLRIIGTNRNWLKNYGVVLGLAKNPKTPTAIAMQQLHRLVERDVKMLTTDRNIPEVLRLAAKKIVSKGGKGE